MSDHIPDVTKMIGDTPRTDILLVVHDFDPKPDTIINHARQLERELNAANERISKLNDYVAALETAGDEMAKELSFGYDVDMWRKAKEAKP